MTGRHAALIAAILLIALGAVGLVLLRPMAPENYASGAFDFEAVTDIRASAGIFSYDSLAAILAVGPEDEEAVEKLTGFFEGKGFGRTPGSLFSKKPPVSRVGDIYWTVTFTCGTTGASLSAEYRGGDLRLTGGESVAVTAQDKDTWARRVYEYILSLYPEPEEPEPPEENGASDPTENT